MVAGSLLREDRVRAGTVRADGSLTVDPKPLTLADVGRLQRGSASQAALLLWYWGQWGSAPSIVSSYAPEIVRAVGADAIAGAYAQDRASLVAMRPRVIEESATRAGTVVILEGARRNELPNRYSFTLRRRDGRWQVVYDSLLEAGLAAYVQTRAADDPNARTVNAAAARAGLAAVRRLRAAAFSLQPSAPSAGPRAAPGRGPARPSGGTAGRR